MFKTETKEKRKTGIINADWGFGWGMVVALDFSGASRTGGINNVSVDIWSLHLVPESHSPGFPWATTTGTSDPTALLEMEIIMSCNYKIFAMI